jgi:hypothetical protein
MIFSISFKNKPAASGFVKNHQFLRVSKLVNCLAREINLRTMGHD